MQPESNGYCGGCFSRRSTDRITGRVRVTEDSIVLSAGGEEIALPLRGLRIKLGGASDRLIFFNHPEHPALTLFSTDHSILRNSRLLGFPGLNLQIQSIRKSHTIALGVTAGVLAVLLLIPCSLYLFRDNLVSAAAARIPPEWEARLGTAAFYKIRAQSRMVENAEIRKMFESITSRILTGVERKSLEFEFHIAQDPSVNAFALPGGIVVVNSGLILESETPEEAAGVIAHEIAHVTRRHAIKQIINSAGLYLIIQSLLGDARGLLERLSGYSSVLMRLKYSRKHELEADRTGWEYMVRADIDPRGMVRFFRKLEKKASGSSLGLGRYTEFLSTHPRLQNRIRILDKKSKKLDVNNFTDFKLDFKALKNKIKKQNRITGK